jgi:hypothetical protein
VKQQTYDRTPAAVSIRAMAVTTVSITPAFPQSLPIFLGAVLIPLVDQLGRVGGRVIDLARRHSSASGRHHIQNSKRKTRNGNRTMMITKKIIAGIAARCDAMRFESEVRCGVHACELISLILAHIRHRGFCAYPVTVVGGWLTHDTDNTDRSKLIVEVTSDIHQS